jgi:hypothetical protein
MGLLFRGRLNDGKQVLRLSVGGLPSGLYYLRAATPSEVISRKIIVAG